MTEYVAYGVTDFCNSKACNEALPNPTPHYPAARALAVTVAWPIAQLC